MKLALRVFLLGLVSLTAIACGARAPAAPTSTSNIRRAITVTPAPASAIAEPATPAPTAAATATSLAAVVIQSPSATPTPATSSTPAGATLVVANTGGDGVWIRQTPGTGDKLKPWPDGTVMVVVGPDRQVDGKTWRNVKDPDGRTGWIAGDYLAPPTTPLASPSGAAMPAISPTAGSTATP